MRPETEDWSVAEQGLSPLRYKHPWPVQRIGILMMNVPQLDLDEVYFTPTRNLAPAAANTIAFLDYHEFSDKSIYIDYMITRNRFRQQGYAAALVEHLYISQREAPWIDWGDIMHPAAERLFRSYKQRSGKPQTFGKSG